MEEAEKASYLSIYKQSITKKLLSLNKEVSLLAISYCVLILTDWVDMNLPTMKEPSFHPS